MGIRERGGGPKGGARSGALREAVRMAPGGPVSTFRPYRSLTRHRTSCAAGIPSLSASVRSEPAFRYASADADRAVAAPSSASSALPTDIATQVKIGVSRSVYEL